MATSVPPRPVYIYALLDPRTDEVRYIGRTTHPERRLTEHTQANHLRSGTWRTHWLKALLAAGVRPVLRILEESTQEEWREAERRHIAAHRATGCRLTNATAGGDGMLGWIATGETRRRMSAARKGQPGRVWTDQQRLDASAARKGRTGWRWTAEQRAALSAKVKGRTPAPQTAAARSAALKDKHLTPEHRAKVSAGLKGTVFSAQRRANLSAAAKGRKGQPWSAERRARYEQGRARVTAEAVQLRLAF